MAKTQKLSYPDSTKILNESIKKKQAIDHIVEQMLYASEKDAIKAVNDLLIQAAQWTARKNRKLKTYKQIEHESIFHH